MATVTTSDGLDIFYKDWGTGRPVIFSHGWPLTADAWDAQMKLVADNGFRAIAHDRRGHGRSTQGWDGHDMDHYADDLAAVLDALDVRNAILVGHSTGGGEVVRYLSRHGTTRVGKAVLIGAVPPLVLQTDTNPGGTPLAAYDAIRTAVLTDRSQFYWDLSESFYGGNRAGSPLSEGIRRQFWRLGMQVGLKPAHDCIKAFSETDFRDELPAIDIPVLVCHGDDDQIVPIDAAGARSAELLPHAELKIYPGAPHGIYGHYEQQLNDDLLAYIDS